jgi:putative transposase
MMEIFRKMVNDCIRIGLKRDVSTMKRLSTLCYPRLARYNIITYYKLCAISRAAGMLSNRRKSIKRGYRTKVPYMQKAMFISCYGFKMDEGMFKVPLGGKQYFDIPLNNHTRLVLALEPTIRVRSFVLTPEALSICYSKEVEFIPTIKAIGIDRNLANLTLGNSDNIIQYSLSKVIDIADVSRDVMRSFRRNDVRIGKRLLSKHGRRRKNRIGQLLHRVSKAIVQQAKSEKAAIVFEDIRHIRQLYRCGNYQGPNQRFRMNSWPYHELENKIKYKAAWEGVPVIQLSKQETRGTSQICPRCGKRTQVAKRDDVQHKRQLWCAECKQWLDRDIVAAMNIAYKGLLKFGSPKGLANEAMKRNETSKPLILRVDASKLNLRYNLGFDRT